MGNLAVVWVILQYRKKTHMKTIEAIPIRKVIKIKQTKDTYSLFFVLVKRAAGIF